MSSITANLSPAQRRLLNVLHDTGKSAPGMLLRRALEIADCGRAELVGLALADLVEVRRQPSGQLVDIPATPQAVLKSPSFMLRQTGLGISWCCENPLNKLLRAIDAKPRGRFDLRDAADACDDDALTVSTTTEGYTTLHFKGDLKEARWQRHAGTSCRYEFAHAADFVLIGTWKIRTVLGPKA